MFMVALVYGAGIVLADQFAEQWSVFPLFGLGIVLAMTALLWARARPWLIWALFLVTGAANLGRQKSILSPDDLRIVVGAEPRIVTVRGRLTETPYHRVREHDGREISRTLAEVDAVEIRCAGADWRPAKGSLLASTAGILPAAFHGGASVEVEGVVRPPPAAVAPETFDYRAYLARQGIYYQLQVATTQDWTLRAAGGRDTASPAPLADRFSDWAMATLARGLPVEDEPLRLLWAMSLGWKTAMTGEVAEPFMRSGTMHVFAISGLHIALIAGLLVMALRVFRTPRWLCGLLVLPLIWLYTGVTGWQASAIRSTIMASVILSGWSLRRPSDLLNSLALSAFIILLWDPQQLFQASFQLSFSVVLSLAVFTPVFDRLRRRWLAPDPLLPEELRSRWQHGWRRPADYVAASFAVSLAAWIGSLPLIAYYFHLFTPVSLLANLVVVPLSSAALACNLGSLAVGGWLSGASVLLNHAAWFFMVLMIRASEWAADLPAGALNTTTPSLAAGAFYYGLIAAMFSGGFRHRLHRLWILPLLFGLASVMWLQWHDARARTRVTILPLGGGEAVYLQPAGGAPDLLVDCGNDAEEELVLKPFLRAQGVNRLDGFLLTHGAVRNVGGAGKVLGQFAPRQVFFSPVPFRSASYRAVLRAFERIPRLTHTVRAGDTVGPCRVLHPELGDRLTHADDNTIVLAAEFEGIRLLLLSDLGKPGQNLLLTRHPDLRADIVVSGIPAHTEPLADAVLDSLQPSLIIITDAEYPATQRASARLRERLSQRDVPVLYTSETGAVTLRLQPGSWEARTMNGLRLTGNRSS